MYPRREIPLHSVAVSLGGGCSLVAERGYAEFDPEALFEDDLCKAVETIVWRRMLLLHALPTSLM